MGQSEEKSLKKKIVRSRAVRSVAITVLCMLLGIVIAFEYKSIKANASANAGNSTLVEYQNTIIELGNTVDALKQQKDELEQKIAAIENSSNEEIIESLEAENALLRRQAGLTEVTGEGIVITLNYASAGDIARSANLLLSLINELKASDAQEIAINGERLHAMSEVRAVNDYLVVNGTAFYAPITISVIGDAKNLIASIEMSGIEAQFNNFFALTGGEFNLEYREVTVPARSEEAARRATDSLTNEG